MTIYAFDAFEVDSVQFELREDSKPVAIEPQVFRMLVLLVESAGRPVTKDELFDKIWEGRIVSDAALSSRIKSLRQALGDDGATQRYIKTLHGVGFRFVGNVISGNEPQKRVSSDVVQVMTRPMVGVFPFTFDIPEAGYLIDGLAESLIAELAAWRWLPVVSRNATFAQGRDGDMVERARALNIRYAVSGKVTRRGETLRLILELMDVSSCETLLTEIVEGSMGELTEQQPELAKTLLQYVAPEIEGAERRRIIRAAQSEHSAWDLTLKALWALNQPSREGLETALGELENSIRLDPASPMAWSLKAQTYFEIGLNGWLIGDVSQARGCFLEMLAAAHHSIDLDPRGWMGHSLASAGELFAKSAYTPARFHADRALRLNPSAGMAHHFSGCVVGFGGDPDEAIAIQQCVYTVDPNYRHTTVIEADLGLWRFLKGDLEQALFHLDAALKYNSSNQRARQRRIAVRSGLGNIAGARSDYEALMALGAQPTPDYVRASYPFQDPDHGERLIAAMFAPGIAN